MCQDERTPQWGTGVFFRGEQSGEVPDEGVTRSRHLEDQSAVDCERTPWIVRCAPTQHRRPLGCALHRLTEKPSAEGVPHEVQILAGPAGENGWSGGIGAFGVQI